mgnify:CR=1 FL=1
MNPYEYIKVKINEEYVIGIYEGYNTKEEKIIYGIRITREDGEKVGLKFPEDIRSISKIFWFPKEEVEEITIQEQKELNKHAKKNSY